MTRSRSIQRGDVVRLSARAGPRARARYGATPATVLSIHREDLPGVELPYLEYGVTFGSRVEGAAMIWFGAHEIEHPERA